jgi:alkaline phosphatase
MPSGFEHHGAHGDLTAAAVQKGYSVVFTREQMLAAAPSGKLLGLFGENSLVPHCRRGESEMAAQQPRLSEMTRRALSTLERNPKGFFLLIEGSQIDWANHDNDLEYMIGEILTFDRAVGVVLDWVKAERTRSGETLIIVVPDHDTGGLSITGAPVPSLTESGHHVRPGWISGTHTGQDTMIWSQGPYSEHLGRAIDNTDVFHIMKAALLGKPYLRNQSIFDIPAPSR